HGRLRSSMFCFFFSSRRRHTICYRDWSSDVCSSDLIAQMLDGGGELGALLASQKRAEFAATVEHLRDLSLGKTWVTDNIPTIKRSEERRVGKERGGQRER